MDDLFEDDAPEEDNSQAWMATFADLATLLLTFFVLLLSFANLDITQFRMALGSVKDALGVRAEHPGSHEALATSPIEFSLKESSSRYQVIEEMRLLAQVKDLIKDAGLKGKVDAKLTKRGVAVSVKGRVLFGVGDAKLTEAAPNTLKTIYKISAKLNSPLVIEGHTDPTPIRTRRYPSNWELSAARAIAAMRYLVGEHAYKRGTVSVAGYADTRPISSNATPEGRARNRRVEFIFLRPNAAKLSGVTPRGSPDSGSDGSKAGDGTVEPGKDGAKGVDENAKKLSAGLE